MTLHKTRAVLSARRAGAYGFGPLRKRKRGLASKEETGSGFQVVNFKNNSKGGQLAAFATSDRLYRAGYAS